VHNLNYELDDVNVDLYNHECLNKLILIENEDLNKFISKSILFFILSDLNHDLICNHQIIGIGKVDIYDISARILYTFDSNHYDDFQKMMDELYPYSHIDVITINLDQLPDDIFQRYLKLREYVVPD
jgi:hypothetical protein